MCLAITVGELVLGWLAAHLLTRGLHTLVARHPDGVSALFDEGGRGVLDAVFHANVISALVGPAWVIGIALAVYALGGVALDTLAASAFSHPRASFRALGTVVAIDIAVMLAYATLTLVGTMTVGAAHLVTHAWADSRIADLTTLAAVSPILLVGLLVHVVRDVAVVRAALDADVLDSLSRAIRAMVASPRTTVGRRAAVLSASAGLLLAGAAASWRVDHSPLVFVLAGIATQQLCAAGRTLLRLHWLAFLATQGPGETLISSNP